MLNGVIAEAEPRPGTTLPCIGQKSCSLLGICHPLASPDQGRISLWGCLLLHRHALWLAVLSEAVALLFSPFLKPSTQSSPTHCTFPQWLHFTLLHPYLPPHLRWLCLGWVLRANALIPSTLFTIPQGEGLGTNDSHAEPRSPGFIQTSKIMHEDVSGLSWILQLTEEGCSTFTVGEFVVCNNRERIFFFILIF